MKRGRVLLACVQRAAAVICVVTTVPTAGFAEPADSSVKTTTRPANQALIGEIRVTWQDIVKLIDEHPQIAAGRQDVVAARAAVNAASAVPNPSIEATAAYAQANDSSESSFEWGLGLSVPLGWIAHRGARIDVAGAEARVADAEAKALRRDVLLQLRVSFWNLIYERERVKALEELNEQTGALAKTVKQRVDKGEVRSIEATRVEVEVEKIAGELEVARSAFIARRAQLAIWLGVRAHERLVAVGDLTALPVPITAKMARDKARIEHPTAMAAMARVQANEANVSVERRARVPSLALEAFTDHELDRSAYGIGVTIDLPLWNWNTGSIEQAEATLAAERKRLEAERLQLEIASIEAQAKCQAGVALAARYKDRVLPRAASATQTTERTYQLGEATLLEVIDARRTLIETRRHFLEALVRAQTDCSQLSALAGKELP